MKSTDVYREARSVLAGWSKAHGFKRTGSGILGWTRAVRDEHLFVWFQVSQDGWDPYAGSKFVVEIQKSRTAEMFSASREALRFRLPHFLTDAELAEVLAVQNEIIRSLIRPPGDYFVLKMDGDVPSWYLKKFEVVSEPYRRGDDIWFRYHEPAHVRRWAEFVLRV